MFKRKEGRMEQLMRIIQMSIDQEGQILDIVISQQKAIDKLTEDLKKLKEICEKNLKEES